MDLFILNYYNKWCWFEYIKTHSEKKKHAKIPLWEMIHHDADWRRFCFTRWLSACLGMRRSWSLTPCLQGSLKTSYTASAAPTASERPCCSRSSSSTLAGSSPTTQSCSVACWRSVLGTLSPLLWDEEFHSLNLNNKACSCHTIIISILHRSFLAIIYIGYLKQSLFVIPIFFNQMDFSSHETWVEDSCWGHATSGHLPDVP